MKERSGTVKQTEVYHLSKRVIDARIEAGSSKERRGEQNGRYAATGRTLTSLSGRGGDRPV